MSYIKIKPIWTKKMSKEDVESIFEIFKNLSPVPSKEWKEINLTGAIAKYGQFIHPETDKEDDTEGIQPKEIRGLLSYCKSLDKLVYFLNRIIPILNLAASNGKFNNYVSDGFISWSLVYNNHIRNFLKEEEEDLNIVIGSIIISFSSVFSNFTQIEREVVSRIGLGSITETDIIDAKNSGILKSKTLSLVDINLDAFYEERIKLWEKDFGRVPQSKEMLRVNPLNFNPKVLDVINTIFGTRQINKLDLDSQKKIALLVDNFALNLFSFTENLFKDKTLSNLSFGNELVKDFSNVLKKILDFNDKLSLHTVKLLLNTLHKYPSLEEYIMKKQTLLPNDIDVIMFISNMFNQIKDNKLITSLQTIKPKYFNVFYRYRVQEYKEIIALVKIFEATNSKKIKTTLPLIKGEVGKYQYEIIDKDNPIGLILGYATDCCQVIGGNGESCLREGYSNPNSSFFVVLKDDKVYAQSWIWERDSKEGKAFCFDSLEVLGKNLNKSKDILNCYKEATKQLLETHDIVFVGADGQQMPEGLSEVGEIWNYNKLVNKDMIYPNDNIYSDLRTDGAVIFGQKNKKEKK